MLSQLVDAVGHLLKLYGPQFMPVFDQLVVPAFAPYLAAEQPEALQVLPLLPSLVNPARLLPINDPPS